MNYHLFIDGNSIENVACKIILIEKTRNTFNHPKQLYSHNSGHQQ